MACSKTYINAEQLVKTFGHSRARRDWPTLSERRRKRWQQHQTLSLQFDMWNPSLKEQV
jgi:hypothetical protein